jgi:hypothetical protein
LEVAVSSKVDVYEKLGAFYLGRTLEGGAESAVPLLYDSKDLLTHAVCVGMTGSGKTGLCISLLEEAAIDGIPSIVVDVKGDLGNLLLTFPELTPQAFAPWVDPGQAAREGISVEQFAAKQATLWRDGLAKWDQDGSRIQRLRDAAEFAIYTPGSEAGLPVSILSSFGAPGPELAEDNDLLQERVASTAASLLTLLGIDADPIKSRESILLANILDRAWRAGDDLDLPTLLQRIQAPPFERIGVMPLESFFPEKDRFELAMSLNNLLASPSFQSWMVGDPLDIDRMLYGANGKPRVAIFSIAHLPDAERMFFVSLLLNHTLGWVRRQAGTSSLRAIFYMDEIFGYLPPIGNPPSKKPMLTLLKQARAFGLGIVLATQNPVDLDYKALSNIGTWMIGRLQTERDKERLMDGLLSGDGGLTRPELERMISGLDQRVFLLHNVHEDRPVLFKVRWALSYLRGPLTRTEIKQLTAANRKPSAAGAAGAPGPGARPASPSADAAAAKPMLPADVEERYLPISGRPDGIVYQPFVIGQARIHFTDLRRAVEAQEEVLSLGMFDADGRVDWYAARLLEIGADDLEREPARGTRFGNPPASATVAKSYKEWEKDLAEMVFRSRKLDLHHSPTLGALSKAGETERDFRIRIAGQAREEKDRLREDLRQKYGRKMETLQERVQRAQSKLESEQQQSTHQKLNTALSVGSTLLGALFGRKSVTLTKASRAAKGFGKTFKESQDVARAEEDIATLQQQLQDLDRQLQDELADLDLRFDATREPLETVSIKPKKADVEVRLVALAWAPYRADGEAAF